MDYRYLSQNLNEHDHATGSYLQAMENVYWIDNIYHHVAWQMMTHIPNANIHVTPTAVTLNMLLEFQSPFSHNSPLTTIFMDQDLFLLYPMNW